MKISATLPAEEFLFRIHGMAMRTFDFLIPAFIPYFEPSVENLIENESDQRKDGQYQAEKRISVDIRSKSSLHDEEAQAEKKGGKSEIDKESIE